MNAIGEGRREPLGAGAGARESESPEWWKRAVFYQIAPISFLDTDGDGRGDIKGIIERIDYLKWLGVGAVWLCPIYPAPFRDFGYDISDYTDVDPMYGTLADFDRLVERLHANGIRLRANEPAFTRGRYLAKRSRNDVLAFERTHDAARMLVTLNLSEEPRRLDISGKGELVLSTRRDRPSQAVSGGLTLGGYEGVVTRQR
jgi:alpha amylase-like protein/uncharacterized protein DUF3459